jgi:ABC-type lipoprotein release transport system permease subunit
VGIFGTAWRNVWRNPRRSGVTVAAMTLALFVLILYAGLVRGYMRDMEANIVELEIGDLQLVAPGYRDDPDLYTRIADGEAVAAPLRSDGFQASPRLLAWGLAAADESSAGVQFRGIDVAADAAVSRIHEHVMEGQWLAPEDRAGVVLGRRLARMLDTTVGSEIVVITQGTDGANAYELFRVRGILRAIGDATDTAGVFLLASTFRELVLVEEGVHQIVVRRPEGLSLEVAAAQVRAAAPELDVRTWRELNPTLASMLDAGRQVMLVMYLIVYAAVAILVLNAMLMAAYERIRENGVLKALGVSPFQIFGLMVVEAVIQAVLAVGIGVALGLPALLYLERSGLDMSMLSGMSVMGIAMEPIWYADAGFESFTGPVTALLGIVAFAVAIPALKAARIDPVQALHHT